MHNVVTAGGRGGVCKRKGKLVTSAAKFGFAGVSPTQRHGAHMRPNPHARVPIPGAERKDGLCVLLQKHALKCLKQCNPCKHVEAYRVVRCRCHVLYTVDTQMAVTLCALHTDRASPPPPPRKIPTTDFCYRMSRPQDHSAAGRNQMTSAGIEPAPNVPVCMLATRSAACRFSVSFKSSFPSFHFNYEGKL
jgi:hypothetical protein